MEDIYRQLQRKLNTVGPGMPESKKGNDLGYLRKLFTPEEAEFILKMNKGLFSAAEYADDLHISKEDAEQKLEAMVSDGLVYRVKDEGIYKYYMVPPYYGFIEFNLKRMTPDVINSMRCHFAEGLGTVFNGSDTPVYRYLPVSKKALKDGALLDIDDAEAIVKRQEKIAVTPCFCRTINKTLAGKNTCQHNPDNYEVCLTFGDFADYYLRNDMAREISVEEALDIISQADKNGTVFEALNTKNVESLCNCCACCCGPLGAIRAFGGPGTLHMTNYNIKYDAEKCRQCGKCAERCPTRATKMVEGKPVYNPKKCLGCGLCVTTCPNSARILDRKPDTEPYQPQNEKFVDLYNCISSERKAKLKY